MYESLWLNSLYYVLNVGINTFAIQEVNYLILNTNVTLNSSISMNKTAGVIPMAIDTFSRHLIKKLCMYGLGKNE